MHFRMRYRIGSIAFVFGNCHSPNISNQEITSCNTHLSLDVFFAQQLTHMGHNIFRGPISRGALLLMKGGSHIFFRKMHGRCNNMVRWFIAQLNNVFTQISLNALYAFFLYCLIEMNFFSSHRLALDNGLGLYPFQNLIDFFHGLFPILSPDDLPPSAFEIGFEISKVMFKVFNYFTLEGSCTVTCQIKIGVLFFTAYNLGIVLVNIKSQLAPVFGIKSPGFNIGQKFIVIAHSCLLFY